MLRLFILILMAMSATVMGRRVAAPSPITARFGEITFTTSTAECGVLLVRHASKESEAEKLRIYRVWYNPRIERDTQDIWITDLFFVGATLWIRDEQDRIFSVGVKSFKVTRRRDIGSVAFEELKKNRQSQRNPLIAPDRFVSRCHLCPHLPALNRLSLSDPPARDALLALPRLSTLNIQLSTSA